MSRKITRGGYIRQDTSMEEEPPPSPSSEGYTHHNNSTDNNNAEAVADEPNTFSNPRAAAVTHQNILPAIYAVPTSDTFDESIFMESLPVAYSSNSNNTSNSNGHGHHTHIRKKQQPDASHANNTNDSTTRHAPLPPRYHHASPAANHHKKRLQTPPRPSQACTQTNTSSSPTTNPTKRHNSAASSQKTSNSSCAFQVPQDLPSVTVKLVDINVRSAFDLHPCPTVEEWRAVAEKPQVSSGSSTVSSIHKGKTLGYRRTSPSLQHLEVIQQLQQQSVVRQLYFSPSCGLEADPFIGPHAAMGREEELRMSSSSRKRSTRLHRDGRYRPVDIVQAYIQSLPSHTAPILSHRKKRLPTRADVGFPGATEDEIVNKQKEISHETEWEETTPRLVVLIPSTDLGTTIEDEAYSVKENLSAEHVAWNDGGLESMPFCGPNLMRAMEQNNVQWGRRKHGRRLLPSNPTSVLAPPLDATFSKSQGWRARPFHDRPPGLEYALVCPTLVEFPIGPVEPLLCSLTLYRLPTNGSMDLKKREAYGKMSEDFWFPAGDWRGKVQLNTASLVNENDDSTLEDEQSMLESWHAKLHKAIFSYDTLLSSAPAGSCLFVVMKVFKVAHCAPREHYSPSFKVATDRQNKSFAAAREKSEHVYQQFGMQLLTPISFGVAPLNGYSNSCSEEQKWPRGSTEEINLLPFPAVPESQEAFVERLSRMVSEKEMPSMQSKSSRSQNHEAGVAADDGLLKESKRSRVGRIFRSPIKPRSTRSPSTSLQDVSSSSSTTEEFPSKVSCGRANLFFSSLGVDFLECMLSEPVELMSKSSHSADKLPKVMVDPTGDGAVALHLEGGSNAHQHKRSHLVRMPNATVPALHMQISELREVLALPARPEKCYDLDSSLPCRSLCNLLYVYPRSVKLCGEDRDTSTFSYFTLRVRLIQSNDDGTRASKASIHSNCPWAGQSLVDSVFTTVLGNTGGAALDARNGIPIVDEMKIRLPLLLNGSYSLEFVLFAVDTSSDSALSLKSIADAWVPLSASSARGASGNKVTTCIPNGNHRVKLGDYQLNVETRLISSLHVNDASVATALRDFPYTKTIEAADALVNEAGTKPPEPSAENLLSSAPSASVVAHFPALFHLHLRNLVNPTTDNLQQGSIASKQSLMGIISSLFLLVEKARPRFMTFCPENSNRNHFEIYLKSAVDSFDELALRIQTQVDTESEESSDSPQDDDSIPFDGSPPNEDIEKEERIDEVAIRLKSRMRRSRTFEARVSRITAELGAAGVALHRSSYGASKYDRMRVEAEIVNNAQIEHFFDDDETVATMSTFHTTTETIHGISQMQETPIPRAVNTVERGNTTVLQDSASDQQQGVDVHSLEGEDSGQNEFAQRVKSAAHVMLAPCVGPTLANILAPTSRPNNHPAVHIEESKIASQKDEKTALRKIEFIALSQPGSDAEDEDEDHIGERRRYRGGIGPTFELTANKGDKHFESRGDFLYETVMLLWLRAWLDHIDDGIEDSGSFDNKITNFVVPPGVSQGQVQPIFSFFLSMRFLLPLCIKSLVLRHSIEVAPNFHQKTKALVDEGHLRLLEPFVEMLARGLMGEALFGLKSSETLEQSMLRSLNSSGAVHDFFVGLLTVLHAGQVQPLLEKYFRTLKDCETEHLGDHFEWTEENLHRVRSSRQLRLQAIERFAVLPSFLALNFPRKYVGAIESCRREKAHWLRQYRKPTETDQSAWKLNDEAPTEKMPSSGWLSNLLIEESLSICSLSSESVVAEAMAHIVVSKEDSGGPSSSPSNQMTSALKKRPGAALKRSDLLMFQSLSTQAITCVYELILRRHAMDRRFQGESERGRIAGLFALPILQKSITSVRWLARMEASHKVRSTWLLCLIYVLQEAPEHLLASSVRSFCDPQDFKIHKFLRLLRLCTSSFQNFIDRPLDSKLPTSIDKGLSAWLLQESFNTICAATNVVVDTCAGLTSSYPQEERKMLQGLLDLLLHILTTPQSCVTHLRAVGGALQTLEKFGVELFLEIAGTNFQHWIRVVLSLMNSVSLSVRSIAVDFLVSLVGSIFDTQGNICDFSLVTATVLPEVAAREIAMYSVNNHITTFEDAARAVWPLRRSLVDLDGNPLDDDRIDPHLSPVLSSLCRACQAIIDGVLIELRLKGNKFLFPDSVILGDDDTLVFDADEESIYEAASFFVPETGPMQRIRWFMTLRSLHEKKEQWVEAAESLVMCVQTILNSLRHLKNVWRPSQFLLWSDSRRSHWLETVGDDNNQPDRGNAEVIKFANEFLEPITLIDTKKPTMANRLRQPTAPTMCEILCGFVKDAVGLYLREGGMEEQALDHFLVFQRIIMNSLDENGVRPNFRGAAGRKRFEEDTALRTVLVNLGVEITSLSERLQHDAVNTSPKQTIAGNQAVYVFLRVSGKKPPRFNESTSLPCFLEWKETSICRIPKKMVDGQEISTLEDICTRFARPLLKFLKRECGEDNVELILEPYNQKEESKEDRTYLVVYPAITPPHSDARWSGVRRRRFYSEISGAPTVEMTVAQAFPCPMSRQRSVLNNIMVPEPAEPITVPMS